MLRVVAGRVPGALSRAAPAGGVAFQHAFWAVWAARQASTVAPAQSSQPGQYDPMHALALVKKNAKARFDETVEVAVNLGVDPRKPGQSVRGVVQLPFGTGKSIRVAVFAKGDKAQQARDAGADIVGAEDLIKQIQAGVIEFDRCIATPDMMPLVGRVARILGPRGLMPNPKVGTVTADVADAVSSSRAGQVEFRVEKAGIVHAIIGRVSFPLDKLAGNLRALLVALSRARPEGSRGQYFRSAALSSTMGPGVKVNPQLVDPAKGRQFMASEPLPEGLLAEVEQAAAARAARREAWLKAKQARPKTIVNKWEARATKSKAHA